MAQNVVTITNLPSIVLKVPSKTLINPITISPFLKPKSSNI